MRNHAPQHRVLGQYHGKACAYSDHVAAHGGFVPICATPEGIALARKAMRSTKFYDNHRYRRYRKTP